VGGSDPSLTILAFCSGRGGRDINAWKFGMNVKGWEIEIIAKVFLGIRDPPYFLPIQLILKNFAIFFLQIFLFIFLL